ncbi:metallophosphoesterase [Sulfolobus islandicus Y.G.57.14]|uniref:Metallophosphoesterase n=8 Tax=Saccharolobus islandicus TaxID=43080 RepID=C3MJD0_SACI2|nr:metallophosphoesterase [Sulfolobus islandicus]ACP34208.1 metallophosphoesterase [Sulfolobus islandicus L.S.2.15]ACP36946.1 metallophosphoesterase [Sulfolobus islandicus M.14.25]ACP44348.1 metallophosphoesterase [Sulfolobus islandicus Y.G.57.14]ACP54083.1 metallophosphoesterase [Sulfolobus islandicus M.16.27]ACR40690.1 metallophosphoesterase [Sulfolobus islandicus M.16.4]
MVSLFKRNKHSTNSTTDLRILFSSDLHASYTVFKKFINAGKIYKVNALIIGGDIAGKTLIPIIDLGNNNYNIQDKIVTSSELNSFIERFKSEGIYYAILSKNEYEEASQNKKAQDELFKKAIIATIREWMKIAEERLKDYKIPIFINLGNDDPEYLFEVLKESEIFKVGEGEVFDFNGYEIVSYGYVNPTPWNTFREKKEEEIYNDLSKIVSKITNYSKAIYNFHAPPYNTNLDNAPLLDENLKPIVRGGEIVYTHVGSKSIRRIIEETNPLLGLHGHIHESRGFDKVNNTIVINPGSEYNSGLLHAALVILEGESIKAHQFILG